ncbi:tRNA epoxyqueuosine(34) reductase QueG [Thioflexithrix psekupsensis]|uniref:Epoxyqueuosine reductase n=1 Tax=Thioflexithrix psekupsensis TaxID=1570016 RepID=A0A251X8G7_9GAMM|nr:tRNA epoxyqueuosine(34) reductase QueG [Thioflexithrix psekupsensis]OUD13973.1 tRNA epoxyqueuosine(34) reductase QueG [Thioflexithrix psekupsensis]
MSNTPTVLLQHLQHWSKELGFQELGVSDVDLTQAEQRLHIWLARQYHGQMDYMARHGDKRSRPAELLPGTLRVISLRINYLTATREDLWSQLQDAEHGYISIYAQGRDYHKVLRQRLKQLAMRLEQAIGSYQWRVFVDSAPVLEKPLAEKAGLGWIGKNTNLIHPRAGSFFFLGEIYTDLPLPITEQRHSDHCGRCQACLPSCPTQAFVAPYLLDARRCISYLTIEYKGIIPENLRPLIGNRIYGCDDCQLVCPWNRFASRSVEVDFQARAPWKNTRLLDLWAWSEADFLRHTEGSAIRRVGYLCWLRNLAIALGNAPKSDTIRLALNARLDFPSDLLQEHVRWALARHE